MKEIKSRLRFPQTVPAGVQSSAFQLEPFFSCITPAFTLTLFYVLSCHDIYRYIKNLSNLQNRINMSSCRCCHMMSRACFTPSVAEFSCPAAKTGSHIGIAKCKNGSFLVHTFHGNKLKVSILILRNSKSTTPVMTTCLFPALSKSTTISPTAPHAYSSPGHLEISVLA